MKPIQIHPLSVTRYGTPVYSAKNEIELVRLGIKLAGLGWYRLPIVKMAGLFHKRTRTAWPWNPKCSRGEMAIGRTTEDVERVVNARTQRELGLALGYAPEQVDAFVIKKPIHE